MSKSRILLRGEAVGIIFLFICSCVIPCLAHESKTTINSALLTQTTNSTESKTATITCYTIGIQGVSSSIHSRTVTQAEAEWMIATLKSLKDEMSINPQSEITQELQNELLIFSEVHHLLPKGSSATSLQTQLKKTPKLPNKLLAKLPLVQGKNAEWFCNFATAGDGSTLPIIILPRFIPFILTPIPRAFVYWATPDGITSVGGLISRKGFIAYGEQKGIALGFWGIGFSIFLPPINAYGIFGYAAYARVTAEDFDFWPPNSPPEITQTDPADGQQMVPLTTNKLKFSISDNNGDLMSYNVTTSPDIGSGSGGLKPDGVYSIPVQGLQDLTRYTWRITVTDGKDTVSKTQYFITEPVAPIISNVLPENGDNAVPVDLAQLQFYLKDYQGDAMSYTVTTSPDIGSGTGSNIHDGIVTIPVYGLILAQTYKWYVNVTDGTHWNRKIFKFQTLYPEQFNPFDCGWQYRKSITINHDLVDENLVSFPVLVSITDNDLKMKAQIDGSDILFMNSTGISHKSFFEIEGYQGSTGTLTTWVNIPSVSTDTDTTFYIYYGNPNVLTLEDKEKVWDDNYLVVQHMHQDLVENFKDSTHYHNDIISQTGNPSYQQNGKIGYCVGFHGSDGLSFASPIYNIAPTTVEVWGKPDVVSGYHYLFCNGGETSRSYGFYWYINNGEFGNTIMNLPKWVGQEGVAPAFTGQWYYTASTWDGTNAPGYFIVNDQVITKDSGIDNRNKPANNAKIGQCSEGSYGWVGLIDEVRLSKTARTVGWLTTCYNNYNNPSEFIFIGIEEGP